MFAQDFTMTAQTMLGLEEVLLAELQLLGARNLKKHNRAVSFTGDLGFMYKANLCLRTAIRILVPIHDFQLKHENDLYDGVMAFAWEDYLSADDTLSVHAHINSPLFNHSHFVALRVKDAIVDRFRNKYGKRPSVDLEMPTLSLSVSVQQNTCYLLLDSSASPLFKRGYREATNQAPLNEVLAAGLIGLTGWDKEKPLVDPMCGSGTFLIEAALMANNVPPGYFRADYGFMRWMNYDATLWDTIYQGAIRKITDAENLHLLGADIYGPTLAKARTNIRNAQVEPWITLKHFDFKDLNPPEEKGILLINPPYGERMGEAEAIQALYKSMGDTLKNKWQGWEAWILTANPVAAKAIRLNPDRKIQVFNGALDCRWLHYSLYAGTKRATD